MNDKMQVLFVKKTGHVLAAFTRSADPEGKPKVEDLTGDGLLVRNMSLPATLAKTVLVPPETLDVSVVDFEPALFSSPREFVVGGGKVTRQGAIVLTLVSTAPPAPTPPPALLAGPPPAVKFSAARVTVELDVDVTDEQGVCIILQEANPWPGMQPERRFAEGAIKSATHFVSLEWKTSPGGALASISDPSRSFFVLALVGGYQPLFAAGLPS
jgi:hypothetical protein